MGRFQTDVSHYRRKDGPRWSAPYYIKIAEAFEVDPGRLLGPEEVRLDVTPQQAVLLEVLECAGIKPAEAIVRLTREMPDSHD
jgi:hypothetical protein